MPNARVVTNYAPWPGWQTYLELGGENKRAGGRQVLRLVYDEEAYDLWHLAVRYREVLTCRSLLRKTEIHFEDLPRKEKHLLFYLLLCAAGGIKEIVELGCSVFELIDGMEVVRRYLQQRHVPLPGLKAEGYRFTGIEISPLLADSAIDLHPGLEIRILGSVEEFQRIPAGEKRALFDLGVSNYAFCCSRDFTEFLASFDAALLVAFVSRDGTFARITIGKTLYFFSLQECLENLRKPLYFLFSHPSPYRNEEIAKGPGMAGWFVYADREVVERFGEMIRSVPEIGAFFQSRGGNFVDSSSLVRMG